MAFRAVPDPRKSSKILSVGGMHRAKDPARKPIDCTGGVAEGSLRRRRENVGGWHGGRFRGADLLPLTPDAIEEPPQIEGPTQEGGVGSLVDKCARARIGITEAFGRSHQQQRQQKQDAFIAPKKKEPRLLHCRIVFPPFPMRWLALIWNGHLIYKKYSTGTCRVSIRMPPLTLKAISKIT